MFCHSYRKLQNVKLWAPRTVPLAYTCHRPLEKTGVSAACPRTSVSTQQDEASLSRFMHNRSNLPLLQKVFHIHLTFHFFADISLWTVPRNVDSGIDEIMQEKYGSPDLWTVKMQHFVLDQQHLLRGPRSVDIYDPHHQDEQNVVNRSTRRTPPLPAGSK